MFNNLIASGLAVSPGGRPFDPVGALVAVGVVFGCVVLAYWLYNRSKRRSGEDDDELFQ